MKKNGKKHHLLIKWISIMTAILLVFTAVIPVQGKPAFSEPVTEVQAELAAEEEPAELGAEEEPAEDDQYYTRALAKRSQVFDPADAKLLIPEKTAKQKEKKHTVMVYMIGSNLESRLGNGTKDLEEMEGSGLSYQDVNLIVYTGGSQRWVGDVPCDRNCVLDMSKEGEGRIVAGTDGNASMGAAETLREFLNFCTEYYPAEHFSLIFWDHGGGPLWGYGSDELFDADSLLLSELKTAMDQTRFAEKGKKLDFVGFDACLMASLESMALWKNYADYYIASEELEPGDGWDYSFLPVFEKTDDAAKTAEAVIDHYADYYEKAKTDTFNPDVTLSCVDLSKLEDLESAFEAFSDELEQDSSYGGFSSIMQRRFEAKSFGSAENAKGNVSFYYDLVDLADLADAFSDDYPKETAALEEAVEAAVYYKGGNVKRANGISLYFPSRNKNQFSQMFSAYREDVKSESYTGFLAKSAEQWMKGKARDWVLGDPEEGKKEYTLKLTEDQLDNMMQAFYIVLLPLFDEGSYRVYVDRREIKPDEDGILHIPKETELMEIVADNGERAICPVTYVESDDERTVYKTESMRFFSDLSCALDDIADFSFADLSVLLSVDNESGEVTILSIFEESEEAGSGGKNTVNVDEWGGVYYYSHPRIPTENNAGTLLPYNDWKEIGTSYLSLLSIEDNFSFRLISSEESPDPVLCQVGIEDINGEVYASSLCELSYNKKIRTVDVKTEKGIMTFRVLPDQAALTQYVGEDTELTVPEQVEGVPVTEVEENAFEYRGNVLEKIGLPDTVTVFRSMAFYSCSKLKSIHWPKALETIESAAFYRCAELEEAELPDSLKTIGKNAFGSCRALKEISLPKGLELLGTGAFMYCNNLKSISIPDGNKKYRSEDGVLYSADGSELLVYPGAGAETYRVADKTRRIAYGAFAGAAVKEVQFPDSLEEIDNYAFYRCDVLEVPTFPESLKRVGMNAFDTGNYTYDMEELPKTAVDIRLGKNLENIGVSAFDGFIRRYFHVDEGNPYYMSKGGTLMNKAGDTVISAYIDEKNNIIIPEGTVDLNLDVLAFLDGSNLFSDSSVKYIYIPGSVERIRDAILYGSRNLIFCCPAGSEAEKYAEANGIRVSNETEYDYEVKEISTDKGTLFCRLYSDHAMITGYAGEDETLAIPQEIDGVAVTVIGNGVDPFTYYDFLGENDEAPELETIQIPEGVETISANAFGSNAYYKKLKMELPSTIKEIGSYALGDATGIKLPEGIEKLGECFIRSELTDGFTLRETVRYIAPKAFSYCKGFDAFSEEGKNEQYCVKDGALYSADGTTLLAYPPERKGDYAVPEGVTKIEESAFYNAKIESVSLPVSVTIIGKEAFSDCSSLTSVTFAEGALLEEIGDRAFYRTGLTEIALPSVETLKESAFGYCGELQSVTFAEGIKVIGDTVFQNSPLKNVVLPESLKAIGTRAFSQTFYNEDREPEETFGTLRIGSNVSSIGSSAFYGYKITAFDVDPENPAYASVDGMLTDKQGKILYEIPCGLNGEVRIPEGIEQLEGIVYHTDWTVKESSRITKLYVPDSVTYISGTTFFPANSFETVVVCGKGSYTLQYAMKNGVKYEERE